METLQKINYFKNKKVNYNFFSEKNNIINKPESFTFEELLNALLGDNTLTSGKLKNLAKNENGLLYIEPEALIKIDGMTKAKALRILAAIELGRRQHTQKWLKYQILSPQTIAKQLKIKLTGLGNEKFYLFSLTNNFGFISEHLMASGGQDAVQIYFKDIIRVLLNDRAAKTIIAHNHPNVSSKASIPDIKSMNQLESILKVMGIELLDQFIVGLEGVYSCKYAKIICE